MLEGDYHIRLRPDAVPIQQSPRRVPAALRERLQGTLEDLVKQQIIAPVTEPTPWINSMVVVPKKKWQMSQRTSITIYRESYLQLRILQQGLTKLKYLQL